MPAAGSNVSRARCRLVLAVLLGVPALLAAPAGAQQVVGRTVGVTEEPVGGAVVTFEAEDGSETVRVESDSLGRFRARLQKPGRYRVSVRRLAYGHPAPLTVTVEEDQVLELTVVLDADPMRLGSIEARVRPLARSGLQAALQRIEFNRRTGFGRALVKEEIERRNAIDVPDVVASMSPIIRTRHPISGEPVILLPSRGEPRPVLSMQGLPTGISIPMCHPTVYLDGVAMAEEFDARLVRPEELAAVELYFGLEAPPQYPDLGNCGGTVLLWTTPGTPDGPRLTWGRVIAGGLAVAAGLLVGLGY